MSTGNELVDLHASRTDTDPSNIGFTNIVDTNRPSLAQALESAGYEVIDLGIVRDDFESTADALSRGIRDADVVVSTGGTSMGDSDFLKPVIERRLGGDVVFGRVAMKPG
jgi:gephyrin